MPAVASVPKELYLSTSLKDLNKKTEVKPEKTSTKRYIYVIIDFELIFKILVVPEQACCGSKFPPLFLQDIKSSAVLCMDLNCHIGYAYCLQKVTWHTVKT